MIVAHRPLALSLLPALAVFYGIHLSGQSRGAVTYNKDVQPILQKACIACHSPGQVAPMSFTTYESTRPWVAQIKAVVTQKKMPPGVVQQHYGLFGDDGSLSQHDIETIVKWVDDGAPEGRAQQARPPRNKA
jgi:hypothetical protein